MNHTNKLLVESLLNSTEKCELIAEVYHLPGGHNDDNSTKTKIFLVLVINKTVNEMGYVLLAFVCVFVCSCFILSSKNTV